MLCTHSTHISNLLCTFRHSIILQYSIILKLSFLLKQKSQHTPLFWQNKAKAVPIVNVFFSCTPLSGIFRIFTHPQYNKPAAELWWKLLLNFHRNRRTIVIILHKHKKKRRNCVTMLNHFLLHFPTCSFSSRQTKGKILLYFYKDAGNTVIKSDI